MKALILIAIVKQAISVKEYGEYKLYRQVGGVILDFSGNDYHGRNGNSVSPDSNDGKFTDRGVYLDGVSTYFLIHSDEFGPGPVLTREWSFSIWLLVTSNGPLIHRVNDQGETSFKITLSSTTTDLQYNDCGSTCVLNQYNLNFNYPSYIWYLFSLDAFEDEANFYEDYTLKLSASHSNVYGETSASYTYIGTDSTSFLKGFIYYIQYNSSSLNISNLIATSSTNCSGFCYYSVSSESHCTCNHCSLIESSQCLSLCSIPELAADCATDVTSCNGLYSLDYGCSECPEERWPVCDITISTDYSASLCHSSCSGCTGPTANDCYGCSTLYMNNVSGSCECPANSSIVGSECVCLSSYFMSSSDGTYSCTPCSSQCSECSQSSTFCTSCAQTSANLDATAGECTCPSNSTGSSSSCDCDTGYYLTNVSSAYECLACLFPCETCLGISICSSCANTYILEVSSCICPVGASIVSNECQCSSGSFVDGSQCAPCSSPCSECIGTSTSCTACLPTFSLSGNSCVCPSGSTIVLGQCQCSSGYFLDTNQCVQCASSCLLCSGTATTCSACSPTYNLSGSSCTCPSGSTVVSGECQCNSGSYLELNVDYECIYCSSPCSECSGSPTACTACPHTYNLNGSTCECPEDSHIVSNLCLCNSGFYWVFNTYNDCLPCSFPCSDCAGSSNTCTSCPSSFNLSGSSCVCPSDSTVVSNQCQCDPGFYLELNLEYECTACSSSCQECAGTSTTCTACPSTYNLNGSSCECPENSNIVYGVCECQVGKIMTTSSPFSCQDCQFPCLTCSGEIQTCTACEYSFNLSSSTCQCPTGASITNNQCRCNPGFFLSLSSQSEFECLACSYPCSECSVSASECMECLYTSSNIENGSCVCPANSSLVSEECVCEEEHLMVSNNGVFECLKCSAEYSNISGGQCECPANSEEISQRCECISGYLMVTSDSVHECEKCDSSCKECRGNTSFCVSCSVKNAILNIEEGVCACPENSIEQNGECVCDDNLELKHNKCEQKVEVLMSTFDSSESIVISTAAVIVTVSVLLISDPSSVWIILNSIQIMSYLPLHALELPRRLENTCNYFQLASILPNVAILMFGDNLNSEGLPERWKENGFVRTDFLLNVGQVLLIIIGYISYFFIVLMLACINKSRYLKYLKEFRYNTVLRLWIEIFIEVAVASVISLSQVISGRFNYTNLLGGSIFIVQIGSIFLLWKILYRIRNDDEEVPESVKNRFSCLFYEFDKDKSKWSFFFYVYFMIRRLVYILGLYYFHHYPLFQLVVSFNCSCVQILFLLCVFKFNDKLNQLVAILTESLFCFIYIFMTYYNCEISYYQQETIEYLCLGSVGLMVGILTLNHLAKIFVGISNMFRNRSCTVIDLSAVHGKPFGEESKIFALPSSRGLPRHGDSLNLENIY